MKHDLIFQTNLKKIRVLFLSKIAELPSPQGLYFYVICNNPTVKPIAVVKKNSMQYRTVFSCHSFSMYTKRHSISVFHQ